VAGKLTQNDIDMQITSTGVEEQITLLAKMPEEMSKYLKQAVGLGNVIMRVGMQARIKNFTGSTSQNIKSKVKIGTMVGSVTGITGPSTSGKNARAHVFRFMQDGTYWQNEDNTQPAVYDLLDWVRAKFHPAEKDVKRTAYALARSIKKKGTKGTPIARPVMEENKGAVQMLMKVAIDKIVEAMRVK
jgi:hypothetical protein